MSDFVAFLLIVYVVIGYVAMETCVWAGRQLPPNLRARRLTLLNLLIVFWLWPFLLYEQFRNPRKGKD